MHISLPNISLKAITIKAWKQAEIQHFNGNILTRTTYSSALATLSLLNATYHAMYGIAKLSVAVVKLPLEYTPFIKEWGLLALFPSNCNFTDVYQEEYEAAAFAFEMVWLPILGATNPELALKWHEKFLPQYFEKQGAFKQKVQRYASKVIEQAIAHPHITLAALSLLTYVGFQFLIAKSAAANESFIKEKMDAHKREISTLFPSSNPKLSQQPGVNLTNNTQTIAQNVASFLFPHSDTTPIKNDQCPNPLFVENSRTVPSLPNLELLQWTPTTFFFGIGVLLFTGYYFLNRLPIIALNIARIDTNDGQKALDTKNNNRSSFSLRRQPHIQRPLKQQAHKTNQQISSQSGQVAGQVAMRKFSKVGSLDNREFEIPLDPLKRAKLLISFENHLSVMKKVLENQSNDPVLKQFHLYVAQHLQHPALADPTLSNTLDFFNGIQLGMEWVQSNLTRSQMMLLKNDLSSLEPSKKALYQLEQAEQMSASVQYRSLFDLAPPLNRVEKIQAFFPLPPLLMLPSNEPSKRDAIDQNHLIVLSKDNIAPKSTSKKKKMQPQHPSFLPPKPAVKSSTFIGSLYEKGSELWGKFVQNDVKTAILIELNKIWSSTPTEKKPSPDEIDGIVTHLLNYAAISKGDIEVSPRKTLPFTFTPDEEVKNDVAPFSIEVPFDVINRFDGFTYYFEDQLIKKSYEKSETEENHRYNAKYVKRFCHHLLAQLLEKYKTNSDMKSLITKNFKDIVQFTLNHACLDGMGFECAIGDQMLLTSDPDNTHPSYTLAPRTANQEATRINFAIENDNFVIEYSLFNQLSIRNCDQADQLFVPNLHSWTTGLAKFDLTKLGTHQKADIEFQRTPFQPFDKYEPSNEFAFDNQPSSMPSVVTKISKWFLDGNYGPKIKKYELALQSIISAFKEKKIDLEGLYARYKSHPKNDLEIATLQVLEILLNKKEPGYANARDQQLAFLKALRAALDSTPYKGELKKKLNNEPFDLSVDLLLNICEFRFRENHIYPFCKKLVANYIKAGVNETAIKDGINEIEEKPENWYLENLTIKEQCKAIDAAPAWMKAPQFTIEYGKLRGTLNFDFDPHYQSNLPRAFFDFELNALNGQSKRRECLGMGTPTIQKLAPTLFAPWNITTRINPEFHNFIASLHAQGLKYVYFSLQHDEERWFGDEKARTDVIRELEKEFPGTFSMVVLAQDSPFYYQTGVYAKEESFIDFKATFINQLLKDPHSGFYFPQAWKDEPAFTGKLESIIDDVYNSFFANKNPLTVQDKKDFIELYYSFLILFIVQYSNADTFNVSCKDAIDRAMKVLYAFMKIMHIFTNHIHDPKYTRMRNAYLNAPAAMVKKQAVIPSRGERLFPVDKRLDDKVVQGNLLKLAETYGISKKTELGVVGFNKKKAI